MVGIVPRRAGKTFLELLALLAVGAGERRRAFYASHRRETAAAMWRDDWFPQLEASPLERHLAMRRANGSETITWRGTRSTVRLLPADGDAARSAKSHLAVIDEARELTEEQGEAVEAGIFPTQATTGGQTWIWSNAGTAASTWLAKWRDLGRASVDAGRTEGIAYFEWSADPDDDLDDPATWLACHPGLGYHVLLEALEADREVMTPTDFAVEYLGIWPEALVDLELLDAWHANVDPHAAPAHPLVFALETTEARDRTVIVAAGPPAGQPHRTVVELVEDRDHAGGQWIAPRLLELADRHQPTALVYDSRGPAAASAIDLEAVPTQLTGLRTDAVIAAAGGFHDRTIAGLITHRDDPRLATAVAALRRRAAGGAWCYDRREPDALAAIAAALAAHASRAHAAPTVT